ncbi:MAG: hypothetical protein QOK20_2942 [Acidimicrobiaceae bacterium]|nr:hypothetical protein [Acidimicrobiaceae bacterium]
MGGHLWSDDQLDGLRRAGDPEADGVVAAYFAERSSTHPKDLIGHIVRHERMAHEDRSKGVDDYLRDKPALPAWADTAQIRAGQDVFLEWGLLISLVHYYASLPSMYAVGRGVKVLHLTARLATDTGRRIHETAQLIVNVMSPGGLVVGAGGYEAARRVRLMHAAVRHLVLHDRSVAQTCDDSVIGPHWCADWGVPINQEDLLATLMSFTWVVFQSLRRAGVRISDQDASSYLHAWNVAAYFLGVDPGVLPIDLTGAEHLWGAIARRQFAPTYEGVELTSALGRLLQDRMPRGLHGLPSAQIRYFAGDEVADVLGLRARGVLGAALSGVARAMAVVAMVEQHDRLLRMGSRQIGRIVFKAFLESDRSGNRASFSIPTHLALQWKIPTASTSAPG